MRPALLLRILALTAIGLVGCRPEADAPTPLVVIGIDGAEWRVVERLWEEGKLPHLRRLVDRGSAGVLQTAYNASPVIWTTMATGVTPDRHGITDFVVPTDHGDVPVSSSVRRVPALWNMTTRLGRPTAVVSWWASWPAEVIDGVVISDRALLPVPHRVSPESFEARFEAAVQAHASPHAEPDFVGNAASEARDRVSAALGAELAGEGFDLVLAYFRSVDIASHQSWRYFDPTGFPDQDPPRLAEHRDDVPHAYEATDAAIGAIVARAGPQADILVLSDHGFYAARREEVRFDLDSDLLLERLGWLRRGPAGVEWSVTRAYTWSTPTSRPLKKIRFVPTDLEAGGEAPGSIEDPELLRELAGQLEADLARATWSDGSPAFALRLPDRRSRREGPFDRAILVLGEEAVPPILIDGEPVPELAGPISRLSGTHGEHTHGLVIAAGPSFAPGRPIEGMSIHDVAPTILYALDLPVGEDFAGRPHLELFTESIRAHRPVRSIPSWGARNEGEVATSAVDAELVEELRTLGYLE